LAKRTVKLVVKRKLPKGRVPHRPTRAESQKVRYDRKTAKQVILRELRGEAEKIGNDDSMLSVK
jgi:hypothetical protein